MEATFQHLIKNVLTRNLTSFRTLGDENVMLLKTNGYQVDVELQSGGYDFILPTSTPPAALVGKREYQFHKGSLVALGPEMSLLTKHSPPTSEYTSICINKKFFQDIAQEATGKREITFTNLESTYSPQLLTIIQFYENEMQNHNPSCPIMAQSIAVQLVIQLLRDTHNNTYMSAPEVGKKDNHISRAMEYMQSFYNAGLSIEDICREVNLSPYYFIRLFKTQTGKTPHEYLLAIRLEKAADLLRERVHSIEEIAHICGFVNIGHFSTAFKNMQGVTPTMYRKNTHN